MGLIYWVDRTSEDEKEDDEEDGLGSRTSDLKVELEKLRNKHPLILDVKLPSSNVLNVPCFIRSLNTSKQHEQYETDLVEHSMPNPVSVFCRTSSLADIPINPRSPLFFIDSLSHRFTRTRSTNDLDELFVEFASAVQSGNVIVSPSVRCRFDLEEQSLLARSVVKSSLSFQLGTLDGASKPLRAQSFNSTPTKTSGVTSPPFGVRSSLSEEPNSEVSSPASQKSSFNVPERLRGPCSSKNSTVSYQSTSSPCLNVSTGLLYCVWKNGSLHIVFTEGDNCQKVYVANSHKIESSIDKSSDYMYIFYSKTEKRVAEFVGKMKVFSSLILSSDNSRLTETEFVLFGAEEQSGKVKDSSSRTRERKGFSKKVANIFRSNHLSKPKTAGKIGEPCFQIESFVQDPFLNDCTAFDEAELAKHVENGFIANLEIAAIVVKSSMHRSEKETRTGGWGLKFLEKATMDQSGTYLDSSSEIYEGNQEKDRGASWRSIDVLIPAGFHGGPVTRDGGPSTITERWRSAGHCDCGGWDIGCPLTVLHDSNSIVSKAFSCDESGENCKSVNLLIEGAKQGEPTLKLVNVSEGVYAMYFHSTLSALQAFSVGVAIIHSQSPALYPKL